MNFALNVYLHFWLPVPLTYRSGENHNKLHHISLRETAVVKGDTSNVEFLPSSAIFGEHIFLLSDFSFSCNLFRSQRSVDRDGKWNEGRKKQKIGKRRINACFSFLCAFNALRCVVEFEIKNFWWKNRWIKLKRFISWRSKKSWKKYYHKKLWTRNLS